MDHTAVGTDATNPAKDNTAPSSPAVQTTAEPGPHDFEAQKRIHQQIRNDPDYDDWEYGTEPLPHEAWHASRPERSKPPATEQAP